MDKLIGLVVVWIIFLPLLLSLDTSHPGTRAVSRGLFVGLVGLSAAAFKDS